MTERQRKCIYERWREEGREVVMDDMHGPQSSEIKGRLVNCSTEADTTMVRQTTPTTQLILQCYCTWYIPMIHGHSQVLRGGDFRKRAVSARNAFLVQDTIV